MPYALQELQTLGARVSCAYTSLLHVSHNVIASHRRGCCIEAGCTDLYTKLTASTQHGHRVVAFGISKALSTCYNIAMQFHCKSMTEMTCVVANAGSFLPYMYDLWRPVQWCLYDDVCRPGFVPLLSGSMSVHVWFLEICVLCMCICVCVHVCVYMIKLIRLCEYVYIACVGTNCIVLSCTLIWNLLRSCFNPGHSKPIRFAEAGGKVSCTCVIADVNFKTCP